LERLEEPVLDKLLLPLLLALPFAPAVLAPGLFGFVPLAQPVIDLRHQIERLRVRGVELRRGLQVGKGAGCLAGFIP